MKKKTDEPAKEIKSMTLNEFKAWLEGFSEAMNGAPNKSQWQMILARLEKVTPDSRTETHIHYDYWKYRGPWFSVAGENSLNVRGQLDGAMYMNASLNSSDASNMAINPEYSACVEMGKKDYMETAE